MKHSALLVGVLAIAALWSPTESVAQRSGVEIWGAVCGRCHLIQPPDRYTAKDWDAITIHMTVTARLTTAQGEAVLAFLRQGATRAESSGQAPSTSDVAEVTAAGGSSENVFGEARRNDPSVREVFAKNCAACHGAKGKGDGAAAAAFNPRPSDLSNPELYRGRPDEDLVKAITEGVRAMPPFGTQLPRETISDLVKYVRSLAGA